jgi:hypothetical protein
MPPWQRTVLLPVAALCAGCVESYPTEDVVTVNPYEMTQAQRVEALNLLGARGGNKTRWRCAIDSECVLSVGHRQTGGGWTTTNHRLENASIEIRFDKVEDVHYVELAGEGAAAPPPVLAGADRLAAQQGSLLLKLLKRDCRGDKPSSAG